MTGSKEMWFKMFVRSCKNIADGNWCYNTDHSCCAQHCPKVKERIDKQKLVDRLLSIPRKK